MSSMNKSTAGLRVLRHILGMDIGPAVLALSDAKPFLTYDEDAKVLDVIQGHITAYSTMPHVDTILDKATVFLPDTVEPYEYELEQLEHRFIEDNMRAASDAASALLLDGQAPQALQTLIGSLLPLTQGHTSLQLFDFRDTGESALKFYHSQLDGTAPVIKKIGYPTLDAQGGIEDGDMIGIIGRPQAGKTWVMLQIATNYWWDQGEPVLFVTQEMSSVQIEKRALPLIAGVSPAPMHMGKPLEYAGDGLSHDSYMEKLTGAAKLANSSDHPFMIYDSRMAGTVADIEAIAAMHNIRTIFIDGAYMLRHPDPRLGRYARVPENLDLMKQFCQRAGVKMVTSWQFKRNAGKDDASGETPDLDDIGYSHAIAEYMTVIMGLLENPKSITQMNKKKVTIMKGRNGEVGSFDIHWDFANMDFSEITVKETEENLVYL